MENKSKRTVGSSDSGSEGFTLGILGTNVVAGVGTLVEGNGLRVESAVASGNGLGIRANSAWEYTRLTLDIDIDFGQGY